jgi:hypothetical protein
MDGAYPNTPGLIIGAGAGLVLGYLYEYRFVKRLSYTL